MTTHAFEQDLVVVSIPAGADLSSYQFCPVKYSAGTVIACSSAGEEAFGILQNVPTSGQMASVAIGGISRCKVGGSVTRGGRVVAGSASTAIAYVPTSHNYYLGKVMSDSASSGIVAVDIAIGPTFQLGNVKAKLLSFTAAEVIASNATPLVALDHSAMVAAGEIASGDALIFQGAVLQVDGGSASYDQNQNTIAKYQTAGGGASVSLTLANFFNGAADGAMKTLKPIATDVVPEADQDIVLTSSASPKSAAGDRLLKGVIYYTVYTPV